ncbi:MAG: type II toxin-antitoxin system death-on-curing family toxin [Thaumarchaeota archaeon]|nr:type II toxin-antitoxin system death-on-curing family toxin [Nitrososphaerota archaeon]MDE1841448.1 type II toxin-antitoxin system death-on-curing family toxin [Nitrososphaerota archaeon]
MTGNDDIVYPEEGDILLLRKNFNLVSDGYLSRGKMSYILDSVRDMYNKRKDDDLLAAKAAFILFQIISSHPFIDGNKRTAYGTADFFLRLNGYCIKVEPEEALEFIVQIATGRPDELPVRQWVKQHLKKIQ